LDPGVEGLAVANPAEKPSLAEAAETAELRRLREEERGTDEAVAESE
jgi:hypothetical protein